MQQGHFSISHFPDPKWFNCNPENKIRKLMMLLQTCGIKYSQLIRFFFSHNLMYQMFFEQCRLKRMSLIYLSMCVCRCGWVCRHMYVYEDLRELPETFRYLDISTLMFEKSISHRSSHYYMWLVNSRDLPIPCSRH